MSFKFRTLNLFKVFLKDTWEKGLLAMNRAPYIMFINRVSHKKGIDKKLLILPAHGFNSQFLNLFGFSISVSFV